MAQPQDQTLIAVRSRRTRVHRGNLTTLSKLSCAAPLPTNYSIFNADISCYTEFPNCEATENIVEQVATTVHHASVHFNLRVDPNGLETPSNRAEIQSLFSGYFGCSFDGIFLSVYVEALPPKPWPLTCAGVPLYFTTDPDHDSGPMLPTAMGHPRSGRVADEVDGRNLEDWTVVFYEVRNHFENSGISIVDVSYWRTLLTIGLEDEAVVASTLPHTICKLQCRYLHEPQDASPKAKKGSDSLVWICRRCSLRDLVAWRSDLVGLRPRPRLRCGPSLSYYDGWHFGIG